MSYTTHHGLFVMVVVVVVLLCLGRLLGVGVQS
jgi:hypothetical protein